MKAATLEISGELLRQVLAIPEGVDVELAFHREDDTYRLLLKGDGLPDGCEIDPSRTLPPMLKPTYHQAGGIISRVEWSVT